MRGIEFVTRRVGIHIKRSSQPTNFAVWLIGKIAELKQWHRHYQANTVKTEKVLSTFFLGLEVIKRSADNFLKREFTEAKKLLRIEHKVACGYL